MVRYPYSQYHYKPRKKKKKLFLVVFILLLIGGGLFYTIFYLDLYSLYAHIVDLYRIWFNDYRFLEKDLESGNYNVAIHQGLPYLEKRPYNPRLLRYLGEAYYYISTSLTESEKEESLNRAVVLLRKGIVLSHVEDVLSKTYYVLGMSYFSKGLGYYELAALYMLKAIDSGFIDPGIYEVLGYCYYKIGALESAEKYLKKAIETRPKDIARLYLAQTLKDRGKYESARRELEYLIQNTSDDAIVEESYAALVWIDFQEERFDEAKDKIEKILEMNTNSAFAHYWLGNIYEKEGDIILARKEWRMTLRINPKHIGAIDKLY